MPHHKKTAALEGQVLTDLTTGQRYMLAPSEEEMQQGIWQYDAQADAAAFNYIVVEGVTYAFNGIWVDWDEDILEWDTPTMGEWPFGNRLSEEEEYMREVNEVLERLEWDLEYELDEMDRMENEMMSEEEYEDESSEEEVTDDEGYETTPEVDFCAWDYWVMGVCNWLFRIDLYMDDFGWWTL